MAATWRCIGGVITKKPTSKQSDRIAPLTILASFTDLQNPPADKQLCNYNRKAYKAGLASFNSVGCSVILKRESNLGQQDI